MAVFDDRIDMLRIQIRTLRFVRLLQPAQSCRDQLEEMQVAMLAEELLGMLIRLFELFSQDDQSFIPISQGAFSFWTPSGLSGS